MNNELLHPVVPNEAFLVRAAIENIAATCVQTDAHNPRKTPGRAEVWRVTAPSTPHASKYYAVLRYRDEQLKVIGRLATANAGSWLQ